MLGDFDDNFKEATSLVSEITEGFSSGIISRDSLVHIFRALDWDAKSAVAVLESFTSDKEVDVQEFIYWLCGVSLQRVDSGTSQIAVHTVEEYAPDFPVDSCPDSQPDLVRRSSRMATTLKRDPAIFERLRSLQTPLGVSLARCMKPGMDCPDHPMIRTVGAVAGDADCYEVFRELFDPIIRSSHNTRDPTDGSSYPRGLDASKISVESIDASGKYVLGCRIRLVRNLQNARFPPAVLSDERKDVESKLTKALSQLQDCFSGQYTNLQSLASCPEKEQALDNEGLIFDAPESGVDLSSGFGREWPDNRGIFVNSSRRMAAWINYQNHLRLIVTLPGGQVKNTFENLCNVEASIRTSLQQLASDFAWSDRLGFLTTCPSQVGFGGFRISLLMRLPNLSDSDEFMPTCRKLGLQAKADTTPDSADTWLISASGQFGVPEFDTVNRTMVACQKLIELDAALQTME